VSGKENNAMLNLSFRAHRAALKSGTADEQKLFAMVKVMPAGELVGARPPLAFALTIDTSGSMREFADQERAAAMVRIQGLQLHSQASGDGTSPAVNLSLPTKLDQAISAAQALIDDGRLRPDDHVTIIHFDDDARSVLPLTPLSRREAARQAAETLKNYSGGTHIAKGLICAERELSALPSSAAKRVLLLTDGETFDEAECRPAASRLAASNAQLIAIGVGVEYNEDLLRDLAEISQGRPYHLAQMAQLGDILNDEIGTSVREVVTDLRATVSTVKGVQLNAITRVYPSLAEATASGGAYRLGNLAAGDYTVFVLEFTVSGFARPPSRVRIAQLGLTGEVPGLGRKEEIPPHDLFITFTDDARQVSEVDAEVLGYVQQKNVDRMVRDAVSVAASDPAKAQQTLQAAVGMTQRLGNPLMTRILQGALNELSRSGTISVGTRKTVSLGGRTKTVKTGAVASTEGMPSNEDIRKMTGA
jgi:Ca-activated chloride channel family protein